MCEPLKAAVGVAGETGYLKPRCTEATLHTEHQRLLNPSGVSISNSEIETPHQS
jgi:hypothetical protein